MSRRCAILALALGAAVVAGSAVAEPTPAQLETLAEANAQLADETSWEAAIRGYRALLRAEPSWNEPRLQLARVLAWRGDYDASIAEFDQLAASAEVPPGLDVERAEVLSWAGHNDAAAAAFEAALARDPADARAARGLARVHRWSGRRGQADAWYDRALSIEDDPEARRERDALRAELRTSIAADFRLFRDSEDFWLLRSDAEVSREWDFDTRFFARSGTTWVSQDRDTGDVFADAPDEDHGYDGRLGVVRRFGARVDGTLELGGRHWSRSDDRFLGRGELAYKPDEQTVAAFEIAHDDQLERSYSLDSVLGNVGRTSGKLSAWRQLTPWLEGYAEGGGALLTDSNGELYAGASLAFRPLADLDVRIGLAFDAQHYRDWTPLYYSPSFDAGATLSVFGRLPVTGALALVFDLGGGGGVSRELSESSFGPGYRARLGLAWARDGLGFEIGASRSQSQRAIAYITHEVAVRMSWSF